MAVGKSDRADQVSVSRTVPQVRRPLLGIPYRVGQPGYLRRDNSRPMALGKVAFALTLAACWLSGATAAGSSSDPLCAGSYGGARARAAGPLRFGVDPGLAGTVGGVQLSSVPDNPGRDLQALEALRPPGHELVLRLNRLFWSDGAAGITSFERTVATYTR